MLGRIVLGTILCIMILGTNDLVQSEELQHIRIPAEQFTSSQVCGKCHIDIHRYWKSSMHALAYSDPIFQAAYLEAFHKTNGSAKEYCLRCHAPLSLIENPEKPIEWMLQDGIPCDFCHSVSSIDLSQPKNPYTLNKGRDKFGPLPPVAFPAHGTIQQEFFKQSEFCGGCHDLKGENGVGIIETYTEWKESLYPEQGVTCQKCHMPVGTGQVVDPSFKISQAQVNLHDMTGAHSVVRLKTVAEIKISEVQRTKERIAVEVFVTNSGSGHRIPTGTPSRELVLTLEIKNRQNVVLCKEERVFRKTIVDANGKELTSDSDLFLYSHAISQDNRIRPNETREVNFSMDCSVQEEALVTASLSYRYRPKVMKTEEMQINMAEANFPLR